jgi:sugar (pentulose or hexulose) kinase
MLLPRVILPGPGRSRPCTQGGKRMYLTFDVGTTSVKTALYDREGRLLHKVIREYALESPQVGWYEVDPETYWISVISGFREILSRGGISPGDVKAVSGCSQGETIIFLDEEDRPLRPAIVWYDCRAKEEARILGSMVGTEEYYRTTGLLELDAIPGAPKILWVKRNQGELFGKIKKILHVDDYIVYRLTGEYVSSASLLTSSALIDINTRSYWSRITDYLGISGILPPIVEESSVVGTLLPQVARELSLRKEVFVVKGTMDHCVGAVGAGNIRPGVVAETTGSALAVGVTADGVGWESGTRLPFQVHVIPGKYIILPYAQTSGIAYKWFRDVFGAEEIVKAGSTGAAFEELNRTAESIPPGSEGLVFLPFLAGASFPENNMNAKGVMYGITLKHGKGHFVRAILESIGFMLKKILTEVETFGIGIEEVHSMGGGARSDLWLQIKADVCRRTFVRMKEMETPTLGAAIIASVKAGDYGSLEQAVAVMVRTGRKFEPDEGRGTQYDRNYRLYCELYDRLVPLFGRFS